MTVADQALELLAQTDAPFGWIMGSKTWEQAGVEARAGEQHYKPKPPTATPRHYMGMPVRLMEGSGIILEHRW